MKNYDVIIIGQGLVGASLAVGLAQKGCHVAIIDKNPQPKTNSTQIDLDGRKIALSLGSKYILQHFGIWSQLASSATAINKVHISAQGQFGISQLQAKEIDQTALGYVVPAQQLNLTLQKHLQSFENIDYYYSAKIMNIDSVNTEVTLEQQQTLTLKAKLIAAADGATSFTRQHLNIATDVIDYQQTALVTSIQLKQTHNNIAYQRISDMGILALLPMQNNSVGMVCTASSLQIEHLMQNNNTDLLAKLQQNFGYRLGQFQSLGPRFAYPIKMIIAQQQIKNNVILLGNSAHNISPVAAQGFNLALQDCFCLVEQLNENQQDISKTLQHYVELRQNEQQRIIKLTDTIMQQMENNTITRPLLGLGLTIFDNVPTIKQPFINQAAGLTAQVKRLMRANQ